MKKYSKKHIGKKFISNEGYSLEVVDGGSRIGCCTVKIDGRYEREADFSSVKKGMVKNLLHRSVYGVGYRGIGDYLLTTHKKAHKTWVGMLERCYSEKFHKKQPTYRDATVCKEWHNFQVFAEWFKVNYIEGYAIDKDLLSDSKIYSPENCVFIPPALNNFLANKHSNNTSGYIGVRWEKGKWIASIRDGKGKRKHLGCFIDIEEASQAYKKQRAIQAREWQNKMNGILPQQIIQRIA